MIKSKICLSLFLFSLTVLPNLSYSLLIHRVNCGNSGELKGDANIVLGISVKNHCNMLSARVSSWAGGWLDSGGRKYLHYSCKKSNGNNAYSGVCYSFKINNCPANEIIVNGLCKRPDNNCITITGNNCVTAKIRGSSVCNNTQEGNPCDASTGNKYQREVDYRSSTLNFVRYYNSLFDTQNVLGKQWTHSYLGSLTIGNSIKVNRPDGKVLEFSNNNSQWLSDADITDTLTQSASQWIYTTADDTTETYNSDGRLLTTQTRDGRLTRYIYDSDNFLQQVVGPYGRSLYFNYDTNKHLITVTTADNTQISYTYDNLTNNLISVTYPDNTSKTYHYDNTAFPSHLTGIDDENGNRYATWTYDNKGLAISSEHANGAEKIKLSYNPDETTTVTDALGRIKIYTFENHFGLRKPKTIEFQYNDGQKAVTKRKNYTYYPENGWLKEVTDYKGNTTYYEYNRRGLITLETRAVGTPEEYIISTTWHQNFRLPASRTWPGHTQTYTYNAQGQLLSVTTTATP